MRFKRLLATLALGLLVGIGATAPVQAAFNPFESVDCSGAKAQSTVCQEQTKTYTENPATDMLLKVTNIISVIAGIAAVVIIIIAGISYIISGGEGNKVNDAKNAIIYASIGLIVIVLARSIIAFIITKV